jgi:hypothetical protein
MRKWVLVGLIIVAVVALTGVVYVFALLPWHLRWGATASEARMPLTGDEIVPRPRMRSTRAITIRAPASDVWPWIVQIGQGRGGLYSYDWLENLVGCDIHSADRIMPEHQHLAVGDRVRMGPEGYPFYIVQEIEPEQTLLLQAGDPGTGGLGPGSWVLFLQEQEDGATRLISRQRSDYEPTLINHIMWRGFVEPISFVMEQRTLRSLRQRAETHSPGSP